MKILRVIASMDPINGGPCQGIRNSIPAQEIFGVINEVLCFDPPDASFLSKDNFPTYTIGPAVGPYAYCSGLRRWLNQNLIGFDVVIIHGLWLYNSYGTYKVWQEFRNKKKRVPRLYLMPHGMLDPYFQKAPDRKLKAIRNWIFWKLLEKRVVNGVDGILFTCEQELLLARKTFKPYHPRMEINVGYGIQLPPQFSFSNSDKFYQLCPPVKTNSFWLYLSRIHPKKGVDILVKAYLRLKQKVFDIPDLVIAGPGRDSTYGKKLKDLARGSSIHFPGMLEGGTKWGAFSSCEAFILPSHQENFGIAVVEAMACNKPVLISNQVNIWREIEKEEAGLICEDTEEGVLAMLEYWIKQADARKELMGLNARKLYETNYAIDKAAARMIAGIQ